MAHSFNVHEPWSQDKLDSDDEWPKDKLHLENVTNNNKKNFKFITQDETTVTVKNSSEETFCETEIQYEKSCADQEPFVFYTISELNTIEPTVKFVNRNIKTLGRCEGTGAIATSLIELKNGESTPSTCIKLYVEHTHKFPIVGIVIEAFGTLTFPKYNDAEPAPIFQIYFWKERVGMLSTYIETCLKIREDFSLAYNSTFCKLLRE